jgi:hypothetical protein
MVQSRQPSNVIDLAEERARRSRRAANFVAISAFEIATYNMLSWAAYWQWMISGFASAE